MKTTGPEGTKWCPRCETHLPVAAFNKAKAGAMKLQAYCRPCAQAVSRGYLLRKQEAAVGRPRPDTCEVCGEKSRTKYGMHMDHNHETGRVRGWLCSHCNTALGLMRESVLLLLKLAWYLFKHRWFHGRC